MKLRGFERQILFRKQIIVPISNYKRFYQTFEYKWIFFYKLFSDSTSLENSYITSIVAPDGSPITTDLMELLRSLKGRNKKISTTLTYAQYLTLNTIYHLPNK